MSILVLQTGKQINHSLFKKDTCSKSHADANALIATFLKMIQIK